MVNDTANFIAGFGFIPSDWSCKSANEICTKISKGTTPPKSEISDMGEIPFLRVNNLTFKGRLAPDSDFIYVSKDAHENFLARSMAFPNDILMNIVGPPLGKTALLDDSYPEYNMNQAIVFYRLQKNLVDSKYFLEFLNSFKAQQWLQSRSKKTSGQQNLTIEICKELPIILPSLLEQKKIAQILSTWDQAISVTEKLLENSQQQKKALMQQLLTGKKRLLDEKGVRFGGEWNEYSLGNLGNTFTGLTGKTKDDFGSGVPYITYMNIFKNSRIDINQVDYVVIKEDENQNSVRYGDIFFTTSSETAEEVGMSSVLLEEVERLYLNSFCFGFRLSNFKVLLPQFAAYILRSSNIRKQISTLGQGATRYNLSKNQLMKLILRLPTIVEQKKIAEVLTLSDQEIENLQKKLDCLKQEKKALMQQLLTGKKRVKVAA